MGHPEVYCASEAFIRSEVEPASEEINYLIAVLQSILWLSAAHFVKHPVLESISVHIYANVRFICGTFWVFRADL